MVVAESRSTRRIVGRIGRGQDLFETLSKICAERSVRAGELRALGSLESAEVAEYDQAAKAWKPARKFAAGFEILNLTGNVSERDGQLALHAHITLMRDRDNGVELVGGHLTKARTFAVEFVIDAWDDLILRRGVDPGTGLPLWSEAIPLAGMAAAGAGAAVRPKAEAEVGVSDDGDQAGDGETDADAHVQEDADGEPAARAPSWADVAKASENRPEDAHTGLEELEPGDVIEHPKFGRCVVERVEGDYEFAHVRLRNARLVRLSLEILKLTPMRSEDGKKVFRANVG